MLKKDSAAAKVRMPTMFRSISRATFLLIALTTSAVEAAQNKCECTANQKASATADGTCSVADLTDKCTITFSSGSNQAASDALAALGILSDLRFFQFDSRGGDQIFSAFNFLEQDPRMLQSQAITDPEAFTGTIFLALTPSLVAADASTFRPILDIMRSNSSEIARNFVDFNVNSPQRIGFGDQAVFVQFGCFGIKNSNQRFYIKTSWSSAETSGCIID